MTKSWKVGDQYPPSRFDNGRDLGVPHRPVTWECMQQNNYRTGAFIRPLNLAHMSLHLSMGPLHSRGS